MTKAKEEMLKLELEQLQIVYKMAVQKESDAKDEKAKANARMVEILDQLGKEAYPTDFGKVSIVNKDYLKIKDALVQAAFPNAWVKYAEPVISRYAGVTLNKSGKAALIAALAE